MNATHNEVLIQCTKCGTSCAPWLAQCRNCGHAMPGKDTMPAWTDGQASRELLDTLDAMGGRGADMADQDVFRMLDEIEGLSKARQRATELLQGNGSANGPREPRLGSAPKTVQNALIADQLAEFARTTDKLSGGHPEVAAADDMPAAPKKPVTAPPSESMAGTATANDTSLRTKPASKAEPLRAALPVSTEIPAKASVPAPAAPPATTARQTAAAKMLESREIAPPERELELGRKRKAAPEDFLPPDFFDPRDRKPKTQWGRWVFLGLLIVAMLLLAAFLIKRNSLDNRPVPQRAIGDLTQPATK